jgi:four helix bundle protein
MRNFRNYDIWKNGMDLADRVYSLTDSFPKFETYGLCDQLRRAAVSIPSNVAEGSSRTSEAEFTHFLEYSIGSCFEVETQMEIAKRRGYITDKQFYGLLDQLQLEERQINQFISKVKGKE